jgi:hypothetical protein
MIAAHRLLAATAIVVGLAGGVVAGLVLGAWLVGVAAQAVIKLNKYSVLKSIFLH